jgi:DNA-binding response OmpR family regulator
MCVQPGECMPNRVVVVDDDKEIQEIVTFVLSRNGFDVAVAGNGQQLQEVLATITPDLIILDVMMPGIDGYQIFSDLRENAATKHIPVIIMTAHAENIYERISLDLGAAEHITKPFHPLDLVGKVQRLLRAIPQE